MLLPYTKLMLPLAAAVVALHSNATSDVSLIPKNGTSMASTISVKGCYSNLSSGFIGDWYQYDKMSATICTNLCVYNYGSSIAAVAMSGHSCFCGLGLPSSDNSVDSKHCDFACPSEEGGWCGAQGTMGAWDYYTVVKTGLTDDSGDASTSADVTASDGVPASLKPTATSIPSYTKATKVGIAMTSSAELDGSWPAKSGTAGGYSRHLGRRDTRVVVLFGLAALYALL